MNQSLKRVLLLRYKSALIFLVTLIFGIYFFQTFSGINSWKSNYKYFNSEESRIQFEQQVSDSYDFNDSQAGKVLLYYDLNKDRTVYTDNFEKYKEYSLVVFNPVNDANQLPLNSYTYYNEHFILLMIIFITAGVLAFLFDLRTHFTATLFSSKFKRSAIYWEKIKLLGLVAGGSLLIAKLLSLIAYLFFIPSEYLNISLKQHLFTTISGWLTLMAILAISCFIGRLFGEWLFGIGAIVILYLTFSNFLSNIDLIYKTVFIDESIVSSTVSSTELNQVLPIVQTSIQKLNIVPLVTLLILASLALFLGCKIFNAIWLERTGDSIIVPQFNRLLQIIFIFYGMVITSTSTLITTLFPSEELSNYQIGMNILKIIAAFLAYLIASEFILFNKKSKIIEKINFLD